MTLRGRAFVLLLALIALLSTLRAQSTRIEGVDYVMLSGGTAYYGQTYFVRPTFPWSEIRDFESKGYAITSCAAATGTWTFVMSTNTGVVRQHILLADTVPHSDIELWWAKGYRVTSMTYGNGQWCVVVSLGTQYVRQILVRDSRVPQDYVNSYWNRGWRITTMAVGRGGWATVFSQTTISAGQGFFLSQDMGDTVLQKNVNSGYRVVHMNQTLGVYSVVYSSWTNYSQQILLKKEEITKDKIEALWNQGYRITDVTARVRSDDPLPTVSGTSGADSSIDLSGIPDSTTYPVYQNFIRRFAPLDEAFLALQKMIGRSIQAKDWASAQSVVRQMMPYFASDSLRRVQRLSTLLERADSPVDIVNLGAPINTPRAEWDPNPTSDGRYLYFSTSFRPGGPGKQDVFVSEREANRWKAPVSVSPAINSGEDETIDNVSLDGTTLFLSGNFAGTFGKFDIFTAERGPEGWGNLVQLPKPINSEHHDESGYLSADGKALLFTSDRPGGIGDFIPQGTYNYGSTNGNFDIYVALKTSDGWSDAINLGSVINTPYAERSAFLHPDGKTLYFASEGHPGLGGLDVFKSTRLSDTSWTQWSEPVNLGKYINTVDEDWGYKIGINGDTAYFAAKNRPGGLGDWDLWSLTLPKDLRPEEVVTIRGRVTSISGRALSASVKLEDLQTGLVVADLKSDPRDGSYVIALPKGRNYGFFAASEGHYTSSSSLDLRTPTKSATVKKDIRLTPLDLLAKGGVSVELANVFFDTDSDKLRPESLPELRRLAEYLARNPELRIEIGGHTDSVGTEEYNLNLSRRRASSVKVALTDLGLATQRVLSKGYGRRKPVADNSSDEGRAKNRRVEFTVLNDAEKK